MPQHVSLFPMSRRTMLALAGAALAPWELLEASTYGDFCNKKDPAKWSQDEIDRLTTKSPWAREVMEQYAPGTNNGGYGNGSPNGNPNGGGYPGGQGGGMPRIGIGGVGMGGARGPGIGGGGGRGGRGRPRARRSRQRRQPFYLQRHGPLGKRPTHPRRAENAPARRVRQ